VQNEELHDLHSSSSNDQMGRTYSMKGKIGVLVEMLEKKGNIK
jgi:hypothetical protein